MIFFSKKRRLLQWSTLSLDHRNSNLKTLRFNVWIRQSDELSTLKNVSFFLPLLSTTNTTSSATNSKFETKATWALFFRKIVHWITIHAINLIFLNFEYVDLHLLECIWIEKVETLRNLKFLGFQIHQLKSLDF